MKKKKKDLRKEIVRTLQGKKRKFIVDWVEEMYNRAIIEAKDENEVLKMWKKGEVQELADGEIEYKEGSMEITELEEDEED